MVGLTLWGRHLTPNIIDGLDSHLEGAYRTPTGKDFCFVFEILEKSEKCIRRLELLERAQ